MEGPIGGNARFAGCQVFKEPPFLIRPEPNQGTGYKVQGADDAPGQRKSPLWAGFSHTSSIVVRLAGGRWGGKENREVGRYKGHAEQPVAGSLWPVTKGAGGQRRVDRGRECVLQWRATLVQTLVGLSETRFSPLQS